MYPFSLPRRRAALVLAVALACACAGIWAVVYAQAAPKTGALTFAVLDVGQGDALYIESPTGVQLLIDAGPDDALLRALPEVMPPLDRSLDAIVATHPDADHIGGFSELLARYEAGLYISSGVVKSTATARTLEATIDEQGIPRLIARRGMLLVLGGGATLEVLYPDYDVSNLPGEKANEGGIVARLRYGESEALLMADVGAGVESRLLQLEGDALEAEVLKVGHHGSKYSSSKAFVGAVSPAIAVISVGARNTYGHPTAQALSALRAVGAEVIRTDEVGTIVCRSGGLQFVCE